MKHFRVILPTLVALTSAAQSFAIDVDSDGMSDVWEAKYHLTAADKNEDYNGNGLSNLQKSMLGLNPWSNKPDFHIEVIADAGQSQLRLRIDTVFGKVYQFDSSTDRITWMPLLGGDGNPIEVGATVLTQDGTTDKTIPWPNSSVSSQYFRYRYVRDIDVDGDGLTAWEERELGTSDSMLDSENDGMPDAFEYRYGLMPSQNDANGDADGDGTTNIGEYQGGTDPSDYYNGQAPVASFEARSGGANKTKCGTKGFQSNKYYVVKESSIVANYSWSYPGHGITQSGTKVTNATEKITFDRTTCVSTLERLGGSEANGAYWDGTNTPHSYSVSAPLVPINHGQGCTNPGPFTDSEFLAGPDSTYSYGAVMYCISCDGCSWGQGSVNTCNLPVATDTLGIYTNAGGGCGQTGTSSFNEKFSVKLSDEYTTDQLISNTQAAISVPAFGAPTPPPDDQFATFTMTQDQTNVHITKSNYRFKWHQSPQNKYIGWQEIFHPTDDPRTEAVEDTTPVVTVKSWQGTANETSTYSLSPSAPGWYSVQPFQIKSVEFTSDHNALMKNPTSGSEWGDSSVRFETPEWLPGVRNNPISQTKNTKVGVSVIVNVSPAGTTFDLIGSGSHAYLNFNKSGLSSTGADQQVLITADQNLPDHVGILSEAITWTIRIGGQAGVAARSGPHKIYVTYGTPSGSVVTERRVKEVCTSASGKTALSDCADAVFSNLSNQFDLNAGVNGPNPIWLLHDAGQASQCPGLAIFVNAHFQMLGLGTGDIRYCHANPDGTFTASTGPVEINRQIHPGLEHPNPTTHDDYSNDEGLIHWDGDHGANNFEATCLFNREHYALGVGIFTTAKEVVHGAFPPQPSYDPISWNYTGSNSEWETCTEAPWIEAP